MNGRNSPPKSNGADRETEDAGAKEGKTQPLEGAGARVAGLITPNVAPCRNLSLPVTPHALKVTILGFKGDSVEKAQ